MNEPPTNPLVNSYLERMPAWRTEFECLRPMLLQEGLAEELKWRKPCYTHGGANVVIFQPFKELCALLFFKGALLHDPDGALREQGENSRYARRLEFRSLAEVNAAKATLAALIRDAIRVEHDGPALARREPADEGPYPVELEAALNADPGLREAWERLTPGRRRGWLLQLNAAKRSATRLARIDRAAPLILEGFGPHDR